MLRITQEQNLRMSGLDPGFRALQGEIDALTAAPMSKALEKSDLWRNRLKAAVAAYKVPETNREDANQIFDSENAEHRKIHGFSQPADRMLQKGLVGYHLYHPLTGRVDSEPIVYPYTPKVDVFYEQQCVKHVTDGKALNMPHTMLRVLETGQRMGLPFHLCVLMIIQIMKREKQVNYDDVKDIEDPVEFIDALIGFFDFQTERNRILKMMKMCHRKVGQSIAPPVNRYRNLVKDLIYLEGLALSDDEVIEKANREGKKVMFRFLERNTAMELKDYITKKARDEVHSGFAQRTNLQDLFQNVDKLEKHKGFQLQSDKYLVTVDHEVSLFFVNLQEIELEQSDLDELALDVSVEALYNSKVEFSLAGPTRASDTGDMSAYGYDSKEKAVSVEKPRFRRRSGSGNRGNSKTRSNSGTRGSNEPRVEWKDAATDENLCNICGESYDQQTGAKCRKGVFCNVYNKHFRDAENRFCMICAKNKQVKAYHGKAWCKTHFEQIAKTVFSDVFMTTLATMQNETSQAEEAKTTEPEQTPENL